MYGRSTAAPHVRNQFSLLSPTDPAAKTKGPEKIAEPPKLLFLFPFNFQVSTVNFFSPYFGASVVIEYAFAFPNRIAVIPLCTSFT